MIPFEKFSHSSSLAYFSYEKDLHLFDPIISNMVSERYRCAIYSDLEDEEDEVDFVYESEEEEFSNPKKEDDLVSALVEISNSNITFGSIGQESNLDIVPAIPIKTIEPKSEGFTVKIGEVDCSFVDASSFMDPEYKEEKNSQKVGFDLKSEIEVQFSKNVLPASTDSVCISHISHSSDLLRRSRLELGNLLLPIVVSSSATIVEYIDFNFGKPSELSMFTFDPGGDLKHVVNVIEDYIAFFKYFTAALPLNFLVLFPSCADTFNTIFGEQPHLIASPPYTAAQHHDFVFDRGKSSLITNRIQFSVFPLRTVLISVKSQEDPILVFDPGGSLAVEISAVVMFAFNCGVRIILYFLLAIIQTSRTLAFLFHFGNLTERTKKDVKLL